MKVSLASLPLPTDVWGQMPPDPLLLGHNRGTFKPLTSVERKKSHGHTKQEAFYQMGEL